VGRKGGAAAHTRGGRRPGAAVDGRRWPARERAARVARRGRRSRSLAAAGRRRDLHLDADVRPAANQLRCPPVAVARGTQVATARRVARRRVLARAAGGRPQADDRRPGAAAGRALADQRSGPRPCRKAPAGAVLRLGRAVPAAAQRRRAAGERKDQALHAGPGGQGAVYGRARVLRSSQRRRPHGVRRERTGPGTGREHHLRQRHAVRQRPRRLDLSRLLVVLPAQPHRQGRAHSAAPGS